MSTESKRGKLLWYPTLLTFLHLFLIYGVNGQSEECSSPGCACYNFEDGLFLECSGATEDTLRTILLRVINIEERALIQSLSVYELNKTIEELTEGSFPQGAHIRHLQISHSSLQDISENALINLKDSLESLALISGRLTQVPQKALANLKKLAALDLENNFIQNLVSYCFYDLKLMKLSLKGNQITQISEYAFTGLEDSLTDLDLSENKLKFFPMAPLRNLESLDSLRIAWNEISEIPDDGVSVLNALMVLDLSSNNFDKLVKDCFRPFPTLQTLSLYYNSIETVHKNAFVSLTNLESIDLSHNKIVFLDVTSFQMNGRLRTIELSHNHIHYISGVFAKLPELRELYLAENNILEIAADAFVGSFSLNVIYLQRNAIRRIDSKGLSGLHQLMQLHLSNNYIERVPREVFEHCANLSSLSLDGNKIKELVVGTFSKLHRLRELRIQDNRISIVKKGIFSPLPTLLELHLQNNAIEDIDTGAFGTMRSLQHVNLQGNQLVTLGDVFQTSASPGENFLVSIQLNSNGLETLHNDSLKGQASVRIMWLGHNKLTHLQALLFRDLVMVERLYLTNNSISKIEEGAFKPMKSLKVLELSMNKLSHLTIRTFSDLHELEELYLKNNRLRKLDPHTFTTLKKLRILDLADNYLTTVQDDMFQENLPLRTLNLKNCSIMMIDDGAFQGLDNLTELNLDDNMLLAPSLGRLRIHQLHILSVSGNNLSHIAEHSLDGIPSLQELYMNNAEVYQIPENIFMYNVNLVKFHIQHNNLRSLPPEIFHYMTSLRELVMDYNRLVEVPYQALSSAVNLTVLSLSYNDIVTVDVGSFANLTHLTKLQLSHNKIESMSGFAMANLSRLLSVDLRGNQLTSLPANFFAYSSQLRRVDLSENEFHHIPAVALSGQNLPNLEWLNITMNPLNKIHELPSEAKYPVLLELDISDTNLSIVASQDFESFPALKHLYLGYNNILRISPGAFRSLPNLQTLHLGMNSIEILPKERLQGMEHLRILNLTRNRLRELEEFPGDLKSLQILDLSYNQIDSVEKVTFRNLVSLAELHLYGNRIKAISGEAFKPLKKLRLLDLSRNYLENLPLNAFRPLETQIRSLRAEENPLHCGCESQELWEWLRDHQKLVGGFDRGRSVGIGEVESGVLRCEQPPELRGLVFTDLDPHAFCSSPLVLKLAIQDIQPFSVLVSWQSRNHSGLHGYQVAYHSVDNVDDVRGKLLDPKTRSVRLMKLSSGTRYLICVLGLGTWGTPVPENFNSLHYNSSEDDVIEGSALPVMVNTPMTRCTEVTTLEAPDSIIGDSAIGDRGSLASILTRRLGLIVGSCMGFVVFVVLISILGYMKMKKQRASVKREQPLASNPPEYMTYRHFSLQGGDRAENSCPSFIGSTSLNT